MNRSVFALYMEKAAAGEAEYVEKLCRKLAEKLLYVPVLDQESADGRIRLEVYRRADGERKIIPAFSTERNLRAWAADLDVEITETTLIGADLCIALEEGSWLEIDSGQPVTIELSPEQVQQIISVPQEPIVEEVEPALEEQISPEPEAQQPAAEERIRSEVISQVESSGEDPFLNISSDDMAIRDGDGRDSLLSVSPDEVKESQPVVKPGSGGREKKRSILSFLKTGRSD